ncbi:MAG: 30S ribosomal protein S8 [Kiritimatiellia bacterium]|jgi:small subunit ribosomal protein S8|nr:30S ribosomal protein S8 [Kiritimatiellia bacterium]MDP6631627.1 30S ribosomal protein S8 [Kiritimatiellia bacterium]MDP6810226.1 30S ribosomal protein S8 [Kiritimatiellia bacterium]MDP7022868.1 30S ribosomal protein S8 [Kiritimatiellia bacterium]
MSWSDPIADMLTRIRNAQKAEHETVEMPFSRLKGEIAQVLKREGFIMDFVVEGGTPKTLKLSLKYTEEHEPVIRGLKRESRPGLRHYVAATKVPRVLAGQGIAVLSTSSGILTDREARGQNVGGEVLCTIW